MLDLPGSGIKPASPALTGRFFTIEPPGKLRIGFYLLSIILWRVIQVVVFTHSSFLSTAKQDSMVWIYHFLAIHLLKGICDDSNFSLLPKKPLLWVFVCRFLCENRVLFLWDECPKVQLQGCTAVHVESCKNRPIVSPVALLFCTPSSTSWTIQFLYILARVCWCYYFSF